LRGCFRGRIGYVSLRLKAKENMEHAVQGWVTRKH